MNNKVIKENLDLGVFICVEDENKENLINNEKEERGDNGKNNREDK